MLMVYEKYRDKCLLLINIALNHVQSNFTVSPQKNVPCFKQNISERLSAIFGIIPGHTDRGLTDASKEHENLKLPFLEVTI